MQENRQSVEEIRYYLNFCFVCDVRLFSNWSQMNKYHFTVV